MNLIHPSYEILTDINPEKILKNIELAGRTCYDSSSKDDSAEKFCKMVLGRNHESVIEHQSLSIRFIVSRSFLAEITRHRLASYSVASTRYINYAKKGLEFIIPTWIDMPSGEYTYSLSRGLGLGQVRRYFVNKEDILIQEKRFLDNLFDVETLYNSYIKNGRTPQEARAILPNCLKTTIVMTANLREWRHVLKLRTDKSAHPEMRQIMCPLLEELKKKLPVIFDGINYE
jgi:thymidylate synthase (FAD)